MITFISNVTSMALGAFLAWYSLARADEKALENARNSGFADGYKHAEHALSGEEAAIKIASQAKEIKALMEQVESAELFRIEQKHESSTRATKLTSQITELRKQLERQRDLPGTLAGYLSSVQYSELLSRFALGDGQVAEELKREIMKVASEDETLPRSIIKEAYTLVENVTRELSLALRENGTEWTAQTDRHISQAMTYNSRIATLLGTR